MKGWLPYINTHPKEATGCVCLEEGQASYLVYDACPSSRHTQPWSRSTIEDNAEHNLHAKMIGCDNLFPQYDL